MRRNVLVVVAIVVGAGVVGLAGCYFATGGVAFHTGLVRVVATDALTERPVAGAVLAAQWQTSAFLCIEGDCPRTIVRTAEAVTDRFGIAAIPAATVRRPGWEMLHPRQPRVAIYKSGYVASPLHHGTCLLYPPTSPQDAARNDQAAADMLGSAPWQWPPDRFPRFAAAIANAKR